MNFKIEGKKIQIFCSQSNNKQIPVIILNTYADEGEKVWQECTNLKTKDFILVAISNLNWNDDMSPWHCSPLYKGDSEYKGCADNYLNFIKNKVIPNVQKYIKNDLHKEVEYFALAGYSLAGLFAMYSAYKTDIFKKIISASGSMWYPNFEEFILKNKISKNINKIYFSLGNKEKNSKNKILQTVENKTKNIQKYLEKNINSIYEENPGNHFQDANLRIAKGIKWILE